MASKSLARVKTVLKETARFVLFLFQILLFLLVFYRVVPVPITPLMVIRATHIDKHWVRLDQISQHAVKAAITSEDPKFNQHFGFDFGAIKESIDNKLEKGKRLRGGSTISQQTAKNLFLWPHRSWVRKGLEVPITLLMEALWTKRRIMEVYLNIIEMGDGIYGIEAASWAYYKKPAAKLSKAEASLLIVCFPNPRRWTPLKPTAFIRKKQARIQRWMTGFEAYPEWWFEEE